MKDNRYFIAKGKSKYDERVIVFARVAPDEQAPKTGQVFEGTDLAHSLPDGKWVIGKELPSELSNFVEALSFLDTANDFVGASSDYTSRLDMVVSFVSLNS